MTGTNDLFIGCHKVEHMPTVIGQLTLIQMVFDSMPLNRSDALEAGAPGYVGLTAENDLTVSGFQTKVKLVFAFKEFKFHGVFEFLY